MNDKPDESSPDREIDEWLRSAIDQHEHQLVRYAQQFVGDVERARDVVQDTFMKLHASEAEKSPRLSGKDMTKWLYKVCRNRAIDVSRKEKRMMSAPPEQFDERVASNSQSPDAVLVAEERQQALLAQIDRLPPKQQEVLRLKFHAGMSYQEIADVTGHSRSNVGFLLHTAITKLRQRL